MVRVLVSASTIVLFTDILYDFNVLIDSLCPQVAITEGAIQLRITFVEEKEQNVELVLGSNMNNGNWHSIEVKRNRMETTLLVDGSQSSKVSCFIYFVELLLIFLIYRHHCCYNNSSAITNNTWNISINYSVNVLCYVQYCFQCLFCCDVFNSKSCMIFCLIWIDVFNGKTLRFCLICSDVFNGKTMSDFVSFAVMF